MNNMSKAIRIRRMLVKGASVEQIVKATGSSKPYIYTVKVKMKKEDQERQWQMIDALVAKTGITSQPAPVNLSSIQGEYSKHKEMTTWQRIKAAIGF